MQTLESTEEHHSMIQAFVKVAPLLQSLVNDDITVGIYDTEKLIINYPAKSFSLNVNPGDPLVDGDIVTDAIRQNKIQVYAVPPELFRVHLISSTVTLDDDYRNVIVSDGVRLIIDKKIKLSYI